jgi:hypothetical protein
MQSTRIFHWGIGLLLMILFSSCGSKVPDDKEFQGFSSSNFNDSTNVTNQWFPLKPGTQYVFEGKTIENGEKVSHRVVINVTNLTKVINGVR